MRWRTTSPRSHLAAWLFHPDARQKRRGALRDPAQADVLDLQELVEAVLRTLAAKTRFLDAAKRRHFSRDDPGVDADDAVLERFGDAPDAADVAAVEVRGE